MPSIVSVPETIAELTTLVEAGDIPAARKLGKKLVNKAETRELWLIARIATLLEQRPRTAVDILRKWWESAPTAEDRAIIAACAPKNGEQRRPQSQNNRADRRNSRNEHQTSSAVKTEQRNDLRRRRRDRQAQSDAAAFNTYTAERAGVAEGEQIQDRDERAEADKPYGSGFDYDRAALCGTDVAFRCLSCAISRGGYDLPRERMTAGHGDDGLCLFCREADRPYIPELPIGHSLSDAVTARCLTIHTVYGSDTARVLLRAEWRQVPESDIRADVRAAIADYVMANLPTENAATPTASAPETAPPEVSAQESAATKPATKRRRVTAAKAVEKTATEDTPAQELAPVTPAPSKAAATPPAPEAPQAAAPVKPAARKRRPADPAKALARKAKAGKLAACHGCEASRGENDVTGLTVDDGQCGECRTLTDHLAEQADSATLPNCGTCGKGREPHDVRHLAADDGQCTECRELDYAA
ncbi:hypothetical protein [Umezawaea sp. Da 62-37]|uniref:hypothetical protein n=1 Tax=Umezawaea sp. Da 62-37 TaxID=3075927 RepID=UPI0028F71734|nr:hypothetical protein [Umezawaea sp. Da 62-37]WNV83152.1 hypothetical protein RM788_33880 [Umezawaea sp. Da 62-37]